MAPCGSLSILAACLVHSALANDADATGARAQAEDLTALVQLDVQMRLGVERDASATAKKYALGSNASGGANASTASNGSQALNSSSQNISEQAIHESLALLALEDPNLGNEVMKQMKTWYSASSAVYLEDVTFRSKISDLIPRFLPKCKERGYGNAEECSMALDLLRTLHTSLEYVPPQLYVLACRNRLSINFFLWAPGPPMCFQFVDRDKNELVTWAELTSQFGPQTMAGLEPFRAQFLDPDHDGNTTRADFFAFLRSSVLIRDQLPEVDGYNPSKGTAYCLKHLHRMFYKPSLEHRLPWSVKVTSLIALGIFTAVFIIWAECGFRSARK